MTFRPPQYEHLPNSSEEPCECRISQTTSSSEEHLGSQPYDTFACDQPPVSPILRGVIPRNHGSLKVPHHNEQNPILRQQNPSSQVTHDFDVPSPNPGTFIMSPENRKERSWINVLNDWWWWELGSVLLSCACFIAIVITLWIVQERSLSSWHSVISPNALVSTLATISKASIMLAVAACISQLKWLYFERAPHRIQDIRIFDDASRGPLGAVNLLMRLGPREVFSRQSGGAGWSFWASVLTILALASDPFAQQILSFPLRIVPNLSDPASAFISASQIYDTGITPFQRNVQDLNVDMAMQGAVQNGLYNLSSPMTFGCTTANCTWPTFYTLGMCSSCNNVTDRVNVSCEGSKHSNLSIVGKCNFTFPSGLTVYGQYSSSTIGKSGPLLNATAESRGHHFINELGNLTDLLVVVGITRFREEWQRNTGPEAFECRLSWCAKRYSKVKVTKGEIFTPDIRTWPLTSPSVSPLRNDGTRIGQFEVGEHTDFDGPNRTFMVNTVEHNILANWLAADLFTTVDTDAVGRVLYMQPNISQTFANIATSMTNRIREDTNRTQVFGTSYREETYIHVSWPWLILPGVVVLMSVVLLVASIVLSRGDKQGLWKSTTLVPLFVHMRGWEHEGLIVGRWSEMENQAKGMKGRLRRDGQGGLDFLRA
jgi:hypothetical protein